MPISTLLDLPRQCAFSASPRIPAYLAAVASLGIPAYPHWNAFPDVAADIGRHSRTNAVSRELMLGFT
jgi:hypothetical protein